MDKRAFDSCLSLLNSNSESRSLFLPKWTKYIPHIPQPKQLAFLWLDCMEAFYGGAAGGGKTDSALMAALQWVDHPEYHALLIRDTFANLSKPAEGLLARADEWLYGTDAQWIDGQYWQFPSGATISFSYLEDPRAHLNHKSSAYQYIGIDEASECRKEQVLYLFSRLRKSPTNPVPLRFRLFSNPPEKQMAARGAWLKERYIDPRTRDPNVIFIPAKMDDNAYIDQASYRTALSRLDPVTRRQLEDGDWDIKAAGNMFREEWFGIVECAPAGGIEVRGWDLAGSEGKDSPFSVGVKIKYLNGYYFIEHIDRFQGTPGVMENRMITNARVDGLDCHIDFPQDPGQAGKYQAFQLFDKLKGFLVHYSPESGSKAQRANAFSCAAEKGLVKLVRGQWNRAFIDEAVLFPDGEFLDQIDGCSRAFHRIYLLVGDDGHKVGAPVGIKKDGEITGRKAIVSVAGLENTIAAKKETEQRSGYRPIWKREKTG